MKQDNEFWNVYNSERDKLTQLPDADADFIALSNAYEKLNKEGEKKNDNK